MAIDINFRQPCLDMFFQLLNAANEDYLKGSKITEENVTVSLPLWDSSQPGSNTKLTITPIAGKGISGEATDIYYYRLDLLNDIGKSKANSAGLIQTVDDGSITDMPSLIEWINKTFSIHLDIMDVQNTGPQQISGYPKQWTLVLSSDCYAYTNGLSVYVLEPNYTMKGAFPNNQLGLLPKPSGPVS